MTVHNVREAFQLLKERGIAKDKQEVRKWLNEGLIEAEKPVNRRVGWKVEAEALQSFIRKFEAGEFEPLKNRRAANKIRVPRSGKEASAEDTATISMDLRMIRLEEEVIQLRQFVRTMRRELNDLKRVLGFPVLADSPDTEPEEEQTV